MDRLLFFFLYISIKLPCGMCWQKFGISDCCWKDTVTALQTWYLKLAQFVRLFFSGFVDKHAVLKVSWAVMQAYCISVGRINNFHHAMYSIGHSLTLRYHLRDRLRCFSSILKKVGLLHLKVHQYNDGCFYFSRKEWNVYIVVTSVHRVLHSDINCSVLTALGRSSVWWVT